MLHNREIMQLAWNGNLSLVADSVDSRIQRVAEAMIPTDTVFLSAPEDTPTAVIRGGDEVSSWVTMADLLCEDFGIYVSSEAMVFILPVEAYMQDDQETVSYFLGALACESIMKSMTYFEIDPRVETSLSMAALRSLENFVANKSEFDLYPFQWGVATGLAENFVGSKNCPDEARDIFYNPDVLHSNKMDEFLSELDPCYNPDFKADIASLQAAIPDAPKKMIDWAKTLNLVIESEVQHIA